MRIEKPLLRLSQQHPARASGLEQLGVFLNNVSWVSVGCHPSSLLIQEHYDFGMRALKSILVRVMILEIGRPCSLALFPSCGRQENSSPDLSILHLTRQGHFAEFTEPPVKNKFWPSLH